MNLTLNDFIALTKIKCEVSQVVDGVWIGRSAIGVRTLNGPMQPIFGFAAAFTRKQCETSSMYELLEHLAFLPYVYDEDSANRTVNYIIDDSSLCYRKSNRAIKEFFIGAKNPIGYFYGNGCAISTDLQGAVLHSKCELLERHICCEIWYRHSRPLIQKFQIMLFRMNLSIVLDLYTTGFIGDDKFAIAVLDCEEIGFFGLGAAIRSSLNEAYHHAASEIIMLFEDAIKGRTGISSTQESQKQILSLRDRKVSAERKAYFQHIKNRTVGNDVPIVPICQAIFFEPLPNIYAARTFSENAFDPRHFAMETDLPILPLF